MKRDAKSYRRDAKIALKRELFALFFEYLPLLVVGNFVNSQILFESRI